jgi:hypothetical protein
MFSIVLEIISEIQDPLDNSQRIEPAWEKEDQLTRWLRCLSLTEELLEKTKKAIVISLTSISMLLLQTLNDPGIAGLLTSVILPCVQNSSPEVRNMAVKCLGLYSLLSIVRDHRSFSN